MHNSTLRIQALQPCFNSLLTAVNANFSPKAESKWVWAVYYTVLHARPLGFAGPRRRAVATLKTRREMEGDVGLTAGPPRGLDVLQFANARAVEVQGLLSAVMQADRSGAVTVTIPRHLRRRTTSHNRRCGFRNKKQKAVDRQLKAVDANILKSNEDEVVHNEMSASHGVHPCRRKRRRAELKGQLDGVCNCSSDGSQRLATHVWHAKRFSMIKLWGYNLPSMLPGRGHRSKAVFKWLKESAVLHDASYVNIIELRGPRDAIMRVLQLVVEPLNQKYPTVDLTKGEFDGFFYGNAVLHQVSRVGFKAIAPIKFLWRPAFAELPLYKEAPLLGKADESEERKVWIWVHAGAFDNAFISLTAACQEQVLDNDHSVVHCVSRKGELGHIELFGKNALQVLKKVLHPIARTSTPLFNSSGTSVTSQSDSLSDHKFSACPQLSASLLDEADKLPGAAVLALDVCDPRLLQASQKIITQSCEMAVEDHDTEGLTTSEIKLGSQEGPSAMSRWWNLVGKGQAKYVLASPLWDSKQRQDAHYTEANPDSEQELCEMRHKNWLSFLKLGETQCLPCEQGLKGKSKTCSVLLMKHNPSAASLGGWSLILPARWICAFWVPLVFAGGHVLGLEERRWLATKAGLPSFPHDFPDCSAFSELMAVKAAAFAEMNLKRPPSKRFRLSLPSDPLTLVNKVVVSIGDSLGGSIPDDSRCFSTICLDKALGSSCGGGSAVSNAELKVGTDVSSTIARERSSHESTITEQSTQPQIVPSLSNQTNMVGTTTSEVLSVQHTSGIHSKGEKSVGHLLSFCVARTREVLTDALYQRNLSHFPLFDSPMIGKGIVRDGLKRGKLAWRPMTQTSEALLVIDRVVDECNQSCFVRVLVQIPRKGVLEEGAVLFMPTKEDFVAFLCRSKRWQGVKVLDNACHIMRYVWKGETNFCGGEVLVGQGSFQESKMGCKESEIRRPIGFVTSALPPGSVARATAFCEIAGLTKQRVMQMRDERGWRSEIMLLGRSVGSPMLRPVLASICLDDCPLTLAL